MEMMKVIMRKLWLMIIEFPVITRTSIANSRSHHSLSGRHKVSPGPHHAALIGEQNAPFSLYSVISLSFPGHSRCPPAPPPPRSILHYSSHISKSAEAEAEAPGVAAALKLGATGLDGGSGGCVASLEESLIRWHPRSSLIRGASAGPDAESKSSRNGTPAEQTAAVGLSPDVE